VQLLQKAKVDIAPGISRENAEDAVSAAETHQARRLRGRQICLLQTPFQALAEAFVLSHKYSPLHASQNHVYSIIDHLPVIVK
jgi:hypothetical protein